MSIPTIIHSSFADDYFIIIKDQGRCVETLLEVVGQHEVVSGQQ